MVPSMKSSNSQHDNPCLSNLNFHLPQQPLRQRWLNSQRLGSGGRLLRQEPYPTAAWWNWQRDIKVGSIWTQRASVSGFEFVNLKIWWLLLLLLLLLVLLFLFLFLFLLVLLLSRWYFVVIIILLSGVLLVVLVLVLVAMSLLVIVSLISILESIYFQYSQIFIFYNPWASKPKFHNKDTQKLCVDLSLFVRVLLDGWCVKLICLIWPTPVHNTTTGQRSTMSCFWLSHLKLS